MTALDSLVAVVAVAGVALLCFALVSWAGLDWRLPVVPALLVFALALVGEFVEVPISLGAHRHDSAWGETSLLVGLALLPVPAVIVVKMLAIFIEQCWDRRGIRRTLFNTGSSPIINCPAALAATALAGHFQISLTSPHGWALLAVAAVVANAINHCLVPMVIKFSTGASWRKLVVGLLPGQLANWFGNVAASVLIVAAWQYSKSSLIAVPFILITIWQLNRQQHRKSTERDALARLASASAAMPALSLDEMVAEVRRRAADLFGAESATIRVHGSASSAIVAPAADGRSDGDDLQVPLIGSDGELGTLQLSVEQSGALTRQEQDVLTTFANTTAAALETVLAHQAQLHAAQHDSLTGLPNRALLTAEANRIIDTARATGGRAALILIDLDGFKNVNDTLGHAAGDRLLVEIGGRLGRSVRPRDCVARLGGDEFVVLLDGLESHVDAGRLAETLVERVSVPVTLDGLRIAVEASAGVALFPDHGDGVEALLRCADVAMYDAKRRGDGVLHYDSSQDLASPERLSLLADLQIALDADDQLTLHFQPQLDMRTGLTGNVEALVRWTHPERGPLSPAEFVPVIEHSALIAPFTMKVLDTAVRSCVEWQAQASLHGVGVAVNLSARNLMHRDLPEDVARILARHGLPARKLVLEITETAAMNDTEVCESVLGRLRDLGVRLSVDDFGTGYASLTFLRRIDVAEVKLDRAFVADMLEDEAAATIVGATVALAHGLGLTVVAEGVETAEQLSALSLAGCDLAQGYFLSRPVPVPLLAERADAAVAKAAQVGVVEHLPQVHPPRRPSSHDHDLVISTHDDRRSS